MIIVTYHYWVQFVNDAGLSDCKRVEVAAEFDTTDQDHAMELAERHWVEPQGYIPGTMSLA